MKNIQGASFIDSSFSSIHYEFVYSSRPANETYNKKGLINITHMKGNGVSPISNVLRIYCISTDFKFL